MKVFEVELGGKRRRIRFTPMDGAKLWRRFNKPLFNLLMHDCMAVGSNGKSTGEFNPDAQLALLSLGLATDEETVSQWIYEAQCGHSDVTIADFVMPAIKAAFYSGILGKSIDLDAEEDKSGKAQSHSTDP